MELLGNQNTRLVSLLHLGRKGQGTCTFPIALRLGFMNDSDGSVVQGRGAGAKGEKSVSKQHPPTHTVTQSTNLIAFKGKGKRGGR